MQGTIVKVAVEEGQQVAEGDMIVVLEAMKMEQPLNAHKAGTVTWLTAEVGATVSSGGVICEIKDDADPPEPGRAVTTCSTRGPRPATAGRGPRRVAGPGSPTTRDPWGGAPPGH